MFKLEDLKKDQIELKSKLAELVDFINSEEYYTLEEHSKGLISQQRFGMEMYLNSLTKRLYGKPEVGDIGNLMWLTMLLGMYNSSSSSFGSTNIAKSLTDKEEYKVPEK